MFNIFLCEYEDLKDKYFVNVFELERFIILFHELLIGCRLQNLKQTPGTERIMAFIMLYSSILS